MVALSEAAARRNLLPLALLATAAALLAATVAHASLPRSSSRSELLAKPTLAAALASADRLEKARVHTLDRANEAQETLAGSLGDTHRRTFPLELADELAEVLQNSPGADKARVHTRSFALFDKPPRPAADAGVQNLASTLEDVGPEKLASGSLTWEPRLNVWRIRYFASILRWAPEKYSFVAWQPNMGRDPLGLQGPFDGNTARQLWESLPPAPDPVTTFRLIQGGAGTGGALAAGGSLGGLSVAAAPVAATAGVVVVGAGTGYVLGRGVGHIPVGGGRDVDDVLTDLWEKVLPDSLPVPVIQPQPGHSPFKAQLADPHLPDEMRDAITGLHNLWVLNNGEEQPTPDADAANAEQSDEDEPSVTGPFARHHTVPREVRKSRSTGRSLLPDHLVGHPDIKGRAGNPNRWSIPKSEHVDIHTGVPDFNQRWKEELADLEQRKPDSTTWTPTDITGIRDRLVKEFGLEKYRPK